MIGIQSVAAFFPGEQITADTLPEKETLNAQELQLYTSIGVRGVHVAQGYSSFDLALGAARQLLDEGRLPAGDIDLILYIKSRLPGHLISSEASRIQHELGAAKANAVSISDLGCADMSMALKMAADYLTANLQAENVLIVYGCKPYTPRRLRYPVTINGDGGLAAWVTRTADNCLEDIEIQTEGSYWDLFKVEYQDRVFADFIEECSDYRRYGFELAIESKNRFLDLNNTILSRNGLDKSDIDHFILQNISERAYEYYETAFGIRFSPVCRHNLSQYGHLGPSDVLLNLMMGIGNGLFHKGQRVLLMNNSPVAVWSTVLVRV
jgi:3-oxoacyl-[acyl-carrier-protein] synthase-3